MAKERILVVEDEEDILELITYNLAKEGYHVDSVNTGEQALLAVKKHFPDLILLDLMLPGIDGLEICRRLKNDKLTDTIPIIIVSAKGEESDIVTGLEMGADDYISKPFSHKILVARIRTVLRRKFSPAVPETDVIERSDMCIHPGRHEVTIAGEPVNLTFTEFRILHYLASRPGWVFTRGQIVDGVHEEDYAVTERSVDVQIVGLRKKLGEQGKNIETVRGVGYRFRE